MSGWETPLKRRVRCEKHEAGLVAWASAVLDYHVDNTESVDLEQLLTTVGAREGCQVESALELPEGSLMGSSAADLLQLTLGFAVQGPKKEACIAQIMGLEAEVQQILMVEIETALEKIAALKDCPKAQSPFQSRRDVDNEIGIDIADAEDDIEDEVEKVLENNEKEALLRQIETLEEELSSLRQDGREQALRRELELQDQFRDKENLLVQKIEERERQVAILTSKIEDMQRELQQVNDLKDHVEVLSSQAKDASKLEQSLARMKEKLASAGDLARQLQVLEKQNEELLERSLSAEELARQIPKLKAELETCKAAYTDCQLSLSQARVQLEEKAKLLSHTTCQVEGLRKEAVQNHLESQLYQVESDVDADHFVVTDSLGISELNPAIRERIQRLEQENRRLAQQVSEQSEETVSKLQFDLDAVTRVKSKLEAQLHETQVAKSQLEMALDNATQRIADLEEELDEQNKAMEAQREQFKADLLRVETEAEQQRQELCEDHAVQISQMQATHAGETRALSIQWQDQVQELKDMMHAATVSQMAEELVSNIVEQVVHNSELEALQSRITHALRRQADLEQMMEEKQVAWERERVHLQEHIGELENSLEEYKREHGVTNEQLEGVEAQLHEARQVRDRTVAVLEEVQAQNQGLQSELEEKIRELASLHMALDASRSHGDKQRLQIDELNHTVTHLKRRLKSAQVQRGQGQQVSEDRVDQATSQSLEEMTKMNSALLKRVSDLQEQLEESGKENNFARSNSLMEGSNKSSGLSELVKSYEKEKSQLEKDLNMLSIARANEVTNLQRAENRIKQLEKEKDQLEGDYKSLLLKVERYKQQHLTSHQALASTFLHPENPEPASRATQERTDAHMQSNTYKTYQAEDQCMQQ